MWGGNLSDGELVRKFQRPAFTLPTLVELSSWITIVNRSKQHVPPLRYHGKPHGRRDDNSVADRRPFRPEERRETTYLTSFDELSASGQIILRIDDQVIR